MNKPTVGQIVYSLNIGNAARRCEQKLTPMIVTRVGKKLFYCVPKEYPTCKEVVFELSTWNQYTGYSKDHQLYETEQDWVDWKEEQTLCAFIQKSFEYGHNKEKLPLSSLRAIRDIIQAGRKS